MELLVKVTAQPYFAQSLPLPSLAFLRGFLSVFGGLHGSRQMSFDHVLSQGPTEQLDGFLG